MDDAYREQFLSVMTRFHKMKTAISCTGELPMNEMTILKIISETNIPCGQEGINLNMQDIQRCLQISRPAVSYTLNTLEKRSYIVRQIDEKDRRRITIRITPEGQTACEHCVQQSNDQWDQLVSRFGEEDMQELLRLLTRFLDLTEDMMGH